MKKTIRTGLALVVVVAAPTAWAGPYVTLGLAFASEEVTASNSGINHPTRCDRVLYADPSRAPVDAACTDNSVRALVSDSFNLGGAFAGTASIGYAWDRLRIEAEFLSRAHDGGVSRLIGEVDNPALQGKATEWSPDDPPYHQVSDFRSSQVLLNVVYEFGSGSTWSPFVGVGAGGSTRTVALPRILSPPHPGGWLCGGRGWRSPSTGGLAGGSRRNLQRH